MDDAAQNQTYTNPITLTDEPIDFNEISPHGMAVLDQAKIVETASGNAGDVLSKQLQVNPTADAPRPIKFSAETLLANMKKQAEAAESQLVEQAKTDPSHPTEHHDIQMALEAHAKEQTAIEQVRTEITKHAAEATPHDEVQELLANSDTLRLFDQLSGMTSTFNKTRMVNLAVFTAGGALAVGPKILEMKFGIHMDEGTLKQMVEYAPGAILGADYGRKLKPVTKVAEKAGLREPARWQKWLQTTGDYLTGIFGGIAATEVAKGGADLVNLPRDLAPFGDDVGAAGLSGARVAKNMLDKRGETMQSFRGSPKIPDSTQNVTTAQ